MSGWAYTGSRLTTLRPHFSHAPHGRAAFLDALVELIDPAITHFNKRCTLISHNGPRQVIHFKDGTIFEADVVLGADGIKSTVRQAVSGDPKGTNRVVFTRTVAYRALLLWEDVKRAGVTMKLTERSHCFAGVDKVNGPKDSQVPLTNYVAHHHISDQRWKDGE